jgi:hypothetical protein
VSVLVRKYIQVTKKSSVTHPSSLSTAGATILETTGGLDGSPGSYCSTYDTVECKCRNDRMSDDY